MPGAIAGWGDERGLSANSLILLMPTSGHLLLGGMLLRVIAAIHGDNVEDGSAAEEQRRDGQGPVHFVTSAPVG